MKESNRTASQDSSRDIEQILDFVVEIEKLKAVERKTRPVGLKRYENSAEHSWHICLFALMMKDYAEEDIDILRVLKMLLIHDLGEIDAGDTIIYASETTENKANEEAGVRRIVGLLPKPMQQEYIDLWLEFETGQTADSRFARGIDRVPPLLHNLNDDGHSWRQHGIAPEQVLSVNSRAAKSSQLLWDVLSSRLNSAFDAGLLD